MRGSKPRVWIYGQALGLHAPPAVAGRRIASRHHAKVVPTGKRKQHPHKRGFESRPPMHGGIGRNTPGHTRCQGSRADAVTAFNIFRIVANFSVWSRPWYARLSPVSAAQARLQLQRCLGRQGKGRCDIPMPLSRRQWPCIATLICSSRREVRLRAWRDQCLASSRLLSNKLRRRGVGCGHGGLLA